MISHFNENQFAIHESRSWNTNFELDKDDAVSVGLRLMMYHKEHLDISFIFLNFFYAILFCETILTRTVSPSLLLITSYKFIHSVCY